MIKLIQTFLCSISQQLTCFPLNLLTSPSWFDSANIHGSDKGIYRLLSFSCIISFLGYINVAPCVSSFNPWTIFMGWDFKNCFYPTSSSLNITAFFYFFLHFFLPDKPPKSQALKSWFSLTTQMYLPPWAQTHCDHHKNWELIFLDHLIITLIAETDNRGDN